MSFFSFGKVRAKRADLSTRIARRGYFPCICQNSKCRARRTLRMDPTHYVRAPRCRDCGSRCPCGKRETHRETKQCGKRPGLRLDLYRIRKERGRNVCRCHWYGFPHARGRGLCEHNARVDNADRYRAMMPYHGPDPEPIACSNGCR